MDNQPEEKPSLLPLPTSPTIPDASPLSEVESSNSVVGAVSSIPGFSPSKIKKRLTLTETNHRARVFGIIASLVVVALVLAAVGWYFAKGQPRTVPLAQKSLSDSDLEKLSTSTIGYDSGSQALTFNSGATFNKDLKVLGPVTVKDLTVSGTFTHNTTNVEKSLEVTGDTLLHGLVTAKGLLRVDGNLIVAGTSTFNGNASFNGSAAFAGALSADSISVKSASIGGLSFGHIVTTGATPAISIGIGGGGGSVQISGDDTSGTVTINVGGGAHTGDIANITFRTPFGSTPHINLTPVGASSASSAYYVTRSASAFTVGMVNPVPGVTYIYDYFVAQ